MNKALFPILTGFFVAVTISSACAAQAYIPQSVKGRIITVSVCDAISNTRTVCREALYRYNDRGLPEQEVEREDG